MARETMTFDTVRRIGLSLPDVEEGTAYGSPALKVRGQLMAVVPTHRSAEPDSVAVRVPFDQRDEMIAAEPDVYYIAEHYADYAVVLVRLKRIHLDALRDLLKMSWEFMRRKPRVRRSAATRPLRRPRRQ